MNTVHAAAAQPHQRKIHYVDESIQQALLVGLVLLEAALAAGLAWLMWRQLNAVVEGSLYRIHLADAEPVLAQLLREAARLLGIFVAVNVLALLLVDLLWRRYVRAILSSFAQSMAKTRALDFSSDAPAPGHHRLLDATVAHRAQDRERLRSVRSQVQQLAGVPAGDTAHAVGLLSALDASLPKGRAARPERRRSVRA